MAETTDPNFNFTGQPLAVRMGRLRKLERGLTPEELQAVKLRAMRPRRGQIMATGLGLGAFVAGVFAYSLYATKTSDDVDAVVREKLGQR